MATPSVRLPAWLSPCIPCAFAYPRLLSICLGLFLHYGDLSDSSNLCHIISKTRPDEIYNLGAQSHVKVRLFAARAPLSLFYTHKIESVRPGVGAGTRIVLVLFGTCYNCHFSNLNFELLASDREGQRRHRVAADIFYIFFGNLMSLLVLRLFGWRRVALLWSNVSCLSHVSQRDCLTRPTQSSCLLCFF